MESNFDSGDSTFMSLPGFLSLVRVKWACLGHRDYRIVIRIPHKVFRPEEAEFLTEIRTARQLNVVLTAISKAGATGATGPRGQHRLANLPALPYPWNQKANETQNNL